LVRRYVVQSALIAAGVVALPAVVVTLRPALWIGLFTDAPPIHAIGADYFHLIGPTYFFLVVSMVVASAFQALGRAVVPLAVMIARVALVLAAALLATHVFAAGAGTVFAIIATANVASCLVLVLLFRRTLGARAG
jgi:Na+-driven multidrug efflux pump